MPNQKDNEPLVRHYQAELMRRADHHRLVTIARPRPQRQWMLWFSHRVYRPALAWFGRRLIEAGQAMQPPVEVLPTEDASPQNI